MPVLADLKEELGELKTLKFISLAFTDTAAVKLKNLKAAFEKNSLFYEEIAQVYHVVKKSATMMKMEGIEKNPVKKETLSICITSNHRFYGTLNIDTIERFKKETKNFETNRLVIGSVGIQDLDSTNYPYPFAKVVFKSDYPTIEEIRSFMEKIKHYQPILVYYPLFKTVLSQSVGTVDITQSPQVKEVEQEEFIKNLFEPELPKIVSFFEERIKNLLFIRALLEAELARTAARLMSMTAAEDKASSLIEEKKSQLIKARKSLINRRLLETFIGREKWGKTLNQPI